MGIKLKEAPQKDKLKNLKITALYNQLLNEYSSGSYGYGAIGILGQSCYASIAAMLILINKTGLGSLSQMLELFLVTIFCIGYNATVISQQKNKIQVNFLLISVGISTIFLISNSF